MQIYSQLAFKNFSGKTVCESVLSDQATQVKLMNILQWTAKKIIQTLFSASDPARLLDIQAARGKARKRNTLQAVYPAPSTVSSTSGP